MAESYISGHDGSVTMPAAHGGQIIAWSLRGSQARKDTSHYGGGRGRTFRGGLTMAEFTLRYLARKAGTNVSPGVTAMAIDGVSLTLTADTGLTFVGIALFDSINIDHAMDDPAIGGGMSGVFTGPLAETWA
jgi:hypothetical protein